MGSESHKKPQVISFLSGKGGAGKTSIAIGVSYLLNDAGFRVLLIDFDFATNGASYFYKYVYASQTKLVGTYEKLNEWRLDSNSLPSKVDNMCVEIREGLYFIPSRVNFSKKLPLRDSVFLEEEDLKSFLRSLIELYEKHYDFIIIDNQAGSNLTAKVSASVSEKVIIVSELDPISSDAVETLLIQIGEAFPEYRRHLINKLDIRESEDYKKLSTLFQSMNRLPPLPFDFDVRSAFASRQIPIDVNKPTTFLIALFNTVKSFLPEYRNQIDKYGEKILSKFNQYQDRVDSLLDRKRELQEKIEIFRRKGERAKLRLSMYISGWLVFLGMTAAFIGTTTPEFVFGVWRLAGTLLFQVVGLLLFAVGITYLYVSWLRYRLRTEDVAIKEEIDAELSETDKEIDRYKSLMLTRTKEFLLHFEK